MPENLPAVRRDPPNQRYAISVQKAIWIVDEYKQADTLVIGDEQEVGEWMKYDGETHTLVDCR